MTKIEDFNLIRKLLIGHKLSEYYHCYEVIANDEKDIPSLSKYACSFKVTNLYFEIEDKKFKTVFFDYIIVYEDRIDFKGESGQKTEIHLTDESYKKYLNREITLLNI